MSAAAIADWLVAEGLNGHGDVVLGGGLIERLLEHGVPLFRVFVGFDVLHPIMQRRALRWWRGGEVTGIVAGRQEGGVPGWSDSPFAAMLSDGRTEVRNRLSDPAAAAAYPVCQEIAAEGGTDYVVFRVPFGGVLRFGSVEEVFASFATDRAGGFTDDELALLRGVMPAFTLALHAQGMGIAGRILLDTYLGTDAADRVLSGNIVRGQAEPIHAVIWSSDLSDFTRISDTIEAAELLGLLNAYAEVIVDIVEEAGGNVLKFIGDGLLAIFRQADGAAACAAALDAARRLKTEIATLNARRANAGQPVTEATLALHVGDMLYGNFGGTTRLDFTVLGPAVNETARIAALCRSLDQRIIVSSAFAAQSGPRRAELVSLGRYALRGVIRPEELFTLDPGQTG